MHFISLFDFRRLDALILGKTGLCRRRTQTALIAIFPRASAWCCAAPPRRDSGSGRSGSPWWTGLGPTGSRAARPGKGTPPWRCLTAGRRWSCLRGVRGASRSAVWLPRKACRASLRPCPAGVLSRPGRDALWKENRTSSGFPARDPLEVPGSWGLARGAWRRSGGGQGWRVLAGYWRVGCDGERGRRRSCGRETQTGLVSFRPEAPGPLPRTPCGLPRAWAGLWAIGRAWARCLRAR